MLYKKLLIALVLGASAQSVYASDETVSYCSSCTTDENYMSFSRSLAPENGSVITHIFNMPEFGYKKYRSSKTGYIECEYNDEPDGRGAKQQICRQRYTYTTTELSISNQELSDFTNYALAYNDAEKFFLQQAIEVPRILTGTAFDLVENSNAQGKVISYFNNNVSLKDSFREKFVTIIGSASKIVNNATTLNAPPIVFSFSDNTLAYAVLDFVDTDDQYHFKFIKIKDGNNSLDLKKSNPFTKIYTFNHMSQESWSVFFRALQVLGLTVRGATESLIPKGTVLIVPICDSGKVCPHPN
jgi:hypothetical protein